jgi:hypothetical protein
VGATDARGEQVKDRPVHPVEVLASIYQQLGIDPDGKIPNNLGLDVTVTARGTGRLTELL